MDEMTTCTFIVSTSFRTSLMTGATYIPAPPQPADFGNYVLPEIQPTLSFDWCCPFYEQTSASFAFVADDGSGAFAYYKERSIT